MHQLALPGMFSFILLRLATLVNASQPFLRVRVNLECFALMFVCLFFFQLMLFFNVTLKM